MLRLVFAEDAARDGKNTPRGGEGAEWEVPDRGVAQVHAVADVAHDGIAEADEGDEVDIGAVAAHLREDASDGQNEDERADEQQVDKIPIPWAVAGPDGVSE